MTDGLPDYIMVVYVDIVCCGVLKHLAMFNRMTDAGFISVYGYLRLEFLDSFFFGLKKGLGNIFGKPFLRYPSDKDLELTKYPTCKLFLVARMRTSKTCRQS